MKIPKLPDSSQEQLLVIQFESYTGRAAGVGLTSETSLHAQTKMEKGSLCQSSHLNIQEPLIGQLSSVAKAQAGPQI